MLTCRAFLRVVARTPTETSSSGCANRPLPNVVAILDIMAVGVHSAVTCGKVAVFNIATCGNTDDVKGRFMDSKLQHFRKVNFMTTIHRRFIAGLSANRYGFNPGQVHVRYVMNIDAI